jgi:hypothetical protein
MVLILKLDKVVLFLIRSAKEDINFMKVQFKRKNGLKVLMVSPKANLSLIERNDQLAKMNIKHRNKIRALEIYIKDIENMFL